MSKRAFFILCKLCGLFQLSHWLYRDRLNILCYHGFSYDDEHLFRPSLFMQPETLRKRLRWLAENGFEVLPLEEGLERLAAGTLPKRCTVVTIDDGFKSVGDLAAPVFRQFGFPAMLYVTSYYVLKQSPIFRLVLQYMAWQAPERMHLLSALVESVTADKPAESPEDLLWQLIEFGERQLTEEQRVSLSRRVAEVLDVDYDRIQERGSMSLLTIDELRALSHSGIDVQLHTHRHRLPDDADEVIREVSDNRAVLQSATSKRLVHFCYPSGYWLPSHIDVLRQLGVGTATTCDPGLNARETPQLTLQRFLDRDDLDQIEFEAELYGFKELMRSARSLLSKPGRRSSGGRLAGSES